MQIINVDLVPGKVMPILHASQFDKGRSLGVKLYNGGAVFELSGAETLTAAVRKPDGNIVTETLTNAGGSLVEIITTEQMTACAGCSLCEIKIENAGDVIGTANFVLDVEEDPTNGGIESESEIDNLATQVAGLVASEVEDQYDSSNVIFDDTPTENHGIGYAVTSEGIRNAIDNALEMTDTASGAIATFESEYALPLHNLEIEINAVQEGTGTPSPSNPRAINGFDSGVVSVCGKNLYNKATITTGKFITNTGTELPNPVGTYSDFISIKTGVPYYFSHIVGIGAFYSVAVYDNEKTFIEVKNINGGYDASNTLTFDKGAYIRVNVNINYVDTCQIEFGTSATTFEAYNGTTYAITWQSEAGTVYGGSLDVTNGKLVITHGVVDLGDLSWSYSETPQQFRASLPNVKLPASGNIKADAICSAYECVAYNSLANNTFAIFHASVRGINVKNSDYTDAGIFKTAMTGQKLAYELATPVTYQLTPTQISAIVGTNNVFTDTNGDTSLEYYTKMGEQTVRIAEGVAVDVINNKNIDTLNTTNKTLVGAVNEVDGKTTVIDVIPNITMQNGYTLANSRLIKVGQMLVGILEISRSTAFANNDVMAKFPYFDSNFNILINSFCSTTDRWNALTPCNVFINNSNGNLIFANNISNVKFVRIPFAIALP